MATSLAEQMFNAYNEVGTPWKTFDGRDVPRWDAINDQVRAKWEAAAKVAIVADLKAAMKPFPTLGRTVLYRLSAQDAENINRRRTSSGSIYDRMQADKWPAGAQAHIGNSVREGEEYPMTIVRTWPDEFGPGGPGVNGQVLLDGNDQLWVTSAKEGTEPGAWSWPPRK